MLNEFREEKNIEADFFKLLKLAQLEEPEKATPSLNQTEDALDLGEDSADADMNLDETLDPGEPGGGEEGLPDLDTDMTEMEAVKELLPWDQFVIIFDPHYAKTLQDTLQLPEPKAKSKSFYIYFSPENKRVEGIINKRLVGGYNQKEVLGEDFAFLKSLSPEGFPPDWKDKLLSDIDELPAVENSKIKEELRKKQEEKEEEKAKEEEEAIETPEEPVDTIGTEGEEEQQEVPAPKSQEVPAPKPVGKVDTKGLASINEFKMRKFARTKEIDEKIKDKDKDKDKEVGLFDNIYGEELLKGPWNLKDITKNIYPFSSVSNEIRMRRFARLNQLEKIATIPIFKSMGAEDKAVEKAKFEDEWNSRKQSNQ